MNKTIKTLAIAIIVTVFFGSAASQTGQTQVSPEEEIRQMILKGIERFNKHEVGTSAGFTPDADFVNVEGMWMRDRDEINRVHTKASTIWLKDAKITLIELKIRFVKPDVVIIRQLHEMTGSRSPSGEELPPHQQLSIRIMVKENGKWLTTAFQNTKVLPTEAIAISKILSMDSSGQSQPISTEQRTRIKCLEDSPERRGEEGCAILASRPLVGPVTKPLYWHIDRFESLKAAKKAAGPDGVAAEAHGSVWLMTVEAKTKDHHGGRHAAWIGPLTMPDADGYTMRIMSSMLKPGASTPIHTHSGPEIFYIVAGTQCLETVKFVKRLGAGRSYVLPGSTIHRGRVSGAVERRLISLVLHDASQPPSHDLDDPPTLVPCNGTAQAQVYSKDEETIRNKLRAIERARLRSLVDADLATARRLHADDFQLINPIGGTLSKEQYLADIASGNLDYLEWEPGEIQVRLYGDSAVIRYQANLRVSVKGSPGRPVTFWHTDLYEKRKGEWQIVWSQATQVTTAFQNTKAISIEPSHSAEM